MSTMWYVIAFFKARAAEGIFCSNNAVLRCLYRIPADQLVVIASGAVTGGGQNVSGYRPANMLQQITLRFLCAVLPVNRALITWWPRLRPWIQLHPQRLIIPKAKWRKSLT